MESDKSTDNEIELTSTSSCGMGKLLSTNKEEKSDSNDTLPTSSTDASTSFKATNLVPDDPISSTSSETDPIKTKELITEQEKTNLSELEEVELLEMSMATVNEKIEENVDDLVNDLETLLGESSQAFSLHNTGLKHDKSNKDISEVENLPTAQNLPDDEVSSNTVSVEKEITQTSLNSQDNEMSKLNTKTNEHNTENVMESENTSDATSNVPKSNEILDLGNNKIQEDIKEPSLIAEGTEIQPNPENIDSSKCLSPTENVLPMGGLSDVAINIEENLNDKADCKVKDHPEQDELSCNKDIVTSIKHINEKSCDTDEHIKAAGSNSQESITEVGDDVNKNENIESNKDERSGAVEIDSNVLNISVVKKCDNTIKDSEHSESKTEILEKCTKDQRDDVPPIENIDTSNEENVCELNKLQEEITVNDETDSTNIQKAKVEELSLDIGENVKNITNDIPECNNMIENVGCKEGLELLTDTQSAIEKHDIVVVNDKLIEENVDIHKSAVDCLEINTDQADELKLDEQLQCSIENKEINTKQENVTDSIDKKTQIFDSKKEDQISETKNADVSDAITNLPDQSEEVEKKVIEKLEQPTSVKEDGEEIESKSILFRQETASSLSDVEEDSVKLLNSQSNISNAAIEKEAMDEDISEKTRLPLKIISDAVLKNPVSDNTEKNIETEPTEEKNIELMDTSECLDNVKAVSGENSKDTNDVTDQYTFNIDEDNSQDNLDVEENLTEKIQHECIEASESVVAKIASDSSCAVESESNIIESQQESIPTTVEIDKPQLTSPLSTEKENINIRSENVGEQTSKPLEHECDHQTQFEDASDKAEVSMLEHVTKVDTTKPVTPQDNVEIMECTIEESKQQNVSKLEDVQSSILKSEMDVEENCSKINVQNKTLENTDDASKITTNVITINEKETINKVSEAAVATNMDSNVEKEDLELSTAVEQIEVVPKEAKEQVISQSVISKETSESKDLMSSVDQEGDLCDNQVLHVSDSQDAQSNVLDLDDNIIVKEIESNTSIEPLKPNIEKGQTEIIEANVNEDKDENVSMHNVEEDKWDTKVDIIEHNVNVEVTEGNVKEETADGIIKDEIIKDHSMEINADGNIKIELTEVSSDENVTKCNVEKEIDAIIKEELEGNKIEEIMEEHIEEKSKGINIKTETNESNIMEEINDSVGEVTEKRIDKPMISDSEVMINEVSITPVEIQSVSTVKTENEIIAKETDQISHTNKDSNIAVTESEQNKGSTEKISIENINKIDIEAIQNDSDEIDMNKDINTDVNKTVIGHDNLIVLSESSVKEEKKIQLEINIRRKTVEQDLEKVVCLSEESSDSDGAEILKCASKDVKGSVSSDNISPVPLSDDQVITSMPLSDDQVSTSVTPLEEQLIHDVSMVEENSNLEETNLIKIAKQAENQESEVTEENQDLLSDNGEANKSPFSLCIVQSTHTKSSNIDDRNLTDRELRDIEAIRAAVASITDSSQDTYDSYLVDSSVTENILPEVSNDVPELSSDPVDIQEAYSNSQSSPRSILIENVAELSNIEDMTKRKEMIQTKDSEQLPVDVPIGENAETQNLENIPADDASLGSNIKDVESNIKEPEKVFDVQQSDTVTNKESETEVREINEEHFCVTKTNSISEKVVLKKIDDAEANTKEKENLTIEALLGSSKGIPEKVENVEDTVLNEKMGKNRARKPMKINEPLSISIEDVEREKIYSPKVTIKPVKVPDDEVSTTSDAEVKGSLKMTITKQSDTMHSILKVFNPEDDSELGENEEPIPKLIIKPKHEQQHSPKTPSRTSKVYSPTSTQRCGSPRVTIKPVVKPSESKNEPVGSLKITFKPVVKADEATKRHSPKAREQDQKNHNPKITIKPIPKPQEQDKDEGMPTTPKVTIKPIKRPHEDTEVDIEQERSSPKITIKPVVRSSEDVDQPNQSTPRLIIKPIKKQEEEMKEHEQGRSSPKISIKPLIKPILLENEDEIEEVKERIVLKINKGNLPTPGKDKSKREYPEDEKSEKLGKIKLKFSTSGGHPHIVQEDEGIKKQKRDSIFSQNPESQLKRALDEKILDKNKKLRTSISPERDAKIEHQINEQKINSPAINADDSRANILAGDTNCLTPSTTKIMELASRSVHVVAVPALAIGATTPVTPTPKKRGRPRKVPLQIRPELTDPINPQATYLSTPGGQSFTSTPESATSSAGRPKRSCRGQNVIATLGIKPRKPRGRGRGSKVNMGDRMPVMVSPIGPIQTVSMKPEKDSKLNKSKFKLMHKAIQDEVKRHQEQIRIIGPEAAGLEGADTVKKESCESSILQVALESKRPQLVNPQKSSTDTITFKHLEVAITKNNFLGKPLVGEDITDNVTVTKRTSLQIDQNDTIIILTDDEEDKSNVHDDEVCYDRTQDRKLSEEYKLAEGIEMTEGRELEEATEDDDDARDSEEDRRRQLVKQRKQEAIKKCRAKRMEKLAKAAELKRKRQEQAKLQREARLAAEEAERAAAEKARINRRYGRYGTPKPQISLIDEPLRESAGTVKSPRGIFDPVNEAVKVPQPSVIVVDEDSNQQVLKADSSNNSMPSTSNQSANPQKYATESMQVDIEESSMAEQSVGTDDLVMMDEETRMSADLRGSRSHTPKHSIAAPIEAIVEDSQGSLGTTESGKSKNTKAPRLEVHQESDSHILTADQLAEYFWNGQGPFMLQEQVAHYLGIKSFKRKYPHVSRRSVEIQERDFLKEQGLASETMCDLGLTAVNAQDILDIMYSDFQDKYEEYCRVQREKQARDFANKQKATQQALKSGYERLDIIEQAVQSAAQWNKQFNKERKEQRKASMDLQNLVVHYPKSKIKAVQTRRIGNFPVALVPGQFTDFYKEFTPTELNNLPLNTMCYDEIKIPVPESESDDSDSSESDSESSSSSSSSDSECGTDCKECNTHDVIGRGGKNITATKESNTTLGTPA